MRACRRNDLELVTTLHRAGFRVSSALSGHDEEEDVPDGRDAKARRRSDRRGGGDGFDLIAELRLLEASAKPVYLIVEAKEEVGAVSHIYLYSMSTNNLNASFLP